MRGKKQKVVRLRIGLTVSYVASCIASQKLWIVVCVCVCVCVCWFGIINQ